MGKYKLRELGQYYYSKIYNYGNLSGLFTVVICRGFDSIGRSKSESCGVYFRNEEDVKEYVNFKNKKLK